MASLNMLLLSLLLLAPFSNGLPGYCNPNYSCPCGNKIGFKDLIHLTSLVPCYGGLDYSTIASPRACDSFIYTATALSLWEVTNMRLAQSNLPLLYFTNCCFGVQYDIPSYENRVQETLPGAVGEIYDEINANLTIGGIIGPQNQELSELLSNITGHQLKKLTVSYSLTNEKLSNHTLFPNLYSTASPESFLNEARLQLLYDFGWRKVAIVATDALYDRARNFYILASRNDSMNLSFPGSFRDDPTSLLNVYKDEDYRIFVAFMPFEISRFVICKAIRAGLTTSKHVWILPGIYDYLWWRDCTCDNAADKFCSCNDCTEEEMRQAIQGMIFVDVSNLLITNETETEEQLERYDSLFDTSILYYFNDPTLTEEDRQYLLHSRAPNAYDAVAVWALAWHAAVEELIEESNDLNATCASITSNDVRDSEILTKKMLEILGESVYCGMSGRYTYSRNSDFEELRQAKVTQFQNDSECTIGLYLNYDAVSQPCPFVSLQPLDSVKREKQISSLEFFNFSKFFVLESDYIQSCPYRWKNRFDGSYCPDCYTAPTDGVCYDESCLCHNNIKEWEIILSLLIMIIGIIIAILLLILNFYYRHNKHFKSSTPALNVIIIIGSIVMYLSVVPLVLSFTGNTVAVTEEERKILLPVSCECTTWLFTLGMVLILSTMLARNWRLYRIFHNSKIVNRKNLSNVHLVGIIILIILPMLVLLSLLSALAPAMYDEKNEPYNCSLPDVIDDSITTKRITYTCRVREWKEFALLYNLLLTCGLIFFSYQNARIRTHFSQEGEFAARAVFVVFLFVIPGFAIDLILLISQNRYFWVKLLLNVAFPSIVLGGLFMPKFIFIERDKKEQTKLTRLQTLTVNYEDKMKEITHLKTLLTQKEASIISMQTYSSSPKLKHFPVSVTTDLTNRASRVKFYVED